MRAQHEILEIEPIIEVIIVSDSRFIKILKESVYDIGESGEYVYKYFKEKNFKIYYPIIIPNSKSVIKSTIKYLIRRLNVNTVITIGGTGISKKDKTVDAVLELSEKIVEGFGELFRRYSEEELGPHTILSRACAVVYRKAIIFTLPGSLNAVKIGVERIIGPTLKHILSEIYR